MVKESTTCGIGSKVRWMSSKYYWLKLKRDFFKRHDIRIVEGMPNGKEYILFYLKLLCESVDHEGSLRFSDEVPYNEEMLSIITDTNIDIVRSAVKIFTGLHMMEILDDGTIFMREVDGMIGSASNNDNALRQARYRERKKEVALLECNTNVTKSNESKSKSKIQSKNNIYSQESDDILDYLNEKAHTKYRHADGNRKHISARLKEGFSVDDCMTVIDKKCEDWMGTEYEQYLRPKTLFGNKFENYLNGKIIKRKSNVVIDKPEYIRTFTEMEEQKDEELPF